MKRFASEFQPSFISGLVHFGVLCRNNIELLLPKARSDYLKRSFSYSGGLLWNNLPEEGRTAKVFIVGLLISTPTRQICKSVIEDI